MKTSLIALFSLTLLACGSNDGDSTQTTGGTAGTTTGAGAGTTTGGTTTATTTGGTTTGGAGAGTTTGGTTTGTTTGTSGCTAANATATNAVSIVNYAYSPDCVKVDTGASITFTNTSTVPHTATTKTGSAETFDSGNIGPSQTFVHAFTTAGEDTVYCTYHPQMTTLTVIVQKTSI